MNRYTHKFAAKCPNNDAHIDYTLTIETGEVIMVEQIVEKCSLLTVGYHENFAEALIEWFGGRQTITAEHHGVQIETVRQRSDSRYSTGGFTDRFRVQRSDGQAINPVARYLVLDYSGRDPHAQNAVRAYAHSVRAENHELADDLIDALNNPSKYPRQW